MDNKDFLALNPKRLITYLSDKISKTQIDRLNDLIRFQTKQLVKLSGDHLRFTKAIDNKYAWRQKVSRAYYCCYIANRALRLAVYGTYNQSPSDHKNISKLPGDFPKESIWANFLTQFRADRNLADYDHEKKSGDLECSPREYIEETEKFYIAVTKYLKAKGDL